MDRPPRKRKQFFIPGVGYVKKTKYYELRRAEVKRYDALLTSASSSTASSSTTPFVPPTSESTAGHDDDVSDSLPRVDSMDECSSTDDETQEGVGPTPFVGATGTMYSEDESNYDEDGEMCTYYFMDDDEEAVDEESDEDEHADGARTITLEQLKVELALWFSNSRCTTRNSRILLKLLREADPHSVFAELPNDPRSLLPKLNPKTVPVPRPMEPGEYAYLGVRRTLAANPSLYDREASSLSLMFHVDGVPLFHSSPVKFWPTLGSFRKRPVFLIALYMGEKDPKCPHEYLREFIDEVIPYLHDGLELRGRQYKFHLHCLLADAPARAFILDIKFPTGYYSCSKCKIPGVRCEGRTCFPSVEDYEARTPTNFYTGTDHDRAERDASTCPLARIPGEHFDIVTGVVLDTMHLIYLGVAKRTIESWLGTATGFRRVISATQLTVINKRMRELKDYCPSEFQRAPRTLSLLAYWRAHEFRQFLLYTVYTVTYDILSEDHLEHILLLQMYCRLLMLNADNDRTVIDYCVQLAKIYITKSCEVFGEHWAIYNAHGLLHVPEDVFRFRGVDEISCFKFESFLFFVKRLVRSGRLPLKQAINRYLEWLYACERLATFTDSGSLETEVKPAFETSHPITLMESDSEYITYRRLRTSTAILRSDRTGDSCCLVDGKYFLEVSHFARSKVDGKLYIAGRKYRNASPLYNFFEDSSAAGIFRCGNLATEVDMFKIDEGTARRDVLQKMYRVPLFGTNDFVCSTLAHEY